MNRIVSSIVYITQFSEQLFESVDYTPNISDELKTKLIEDYKSFIRTSYMYRDNDLIQLAIVLKKYLTYSEVDDIIIEIINEINDWHSLHENYELNIQFRKFLGMIESNHNIMSAIESSTYKIVNDLVLGESNIEKSIEILSELKTTFQLDFSTNNFNEVINHFDQLFIELIDNEVQWLRDWMYHEGEANEKIREIEKLVEQLNDLDFEYNVDLTEFNIDWWEVATSNEIGRQMEKDD